MTKNIKKFCGLGAAGAIRLRLTRIYTTGRGERIPKGFRPKAQGCEERATLGLGCRGYSTRNGLRQPFGLVAIKTTPQSFQGWHFWAWLPRVARPSQPWAGGLNPFGIESS